MNYIGIETCSLTNGEGIRVVLWVSGCSHHCPNCQNPDTWDPSAGQLYNGDAYLKIKEAVSREGRDLISGLTLSGGDPMYPANRPAIFSLCRMFRTDFGDSKTIWLYTGYTMDEIRDDPILDLVDVVVDGEYIEEQRNVNRQWCGSENQRVWRKKNGQWKADPPMYDTDNYTARTCECGTKMDM